MKVFIGSYPVTTHFMETDSIHTVPHKGIDLAMPTGTPVPSIGDGIVTSVTDDGSQSFGKAVHIHMSDGSDVIYGHLSQFNVQSGQIVHTSDVIGYSGNTGFSTGPHLHLQVLRNGVPIDPSSYIQPVNNSIPWWDLSGQATHAADSVLEWLRLKLYFMFDAASQGFLNFLDVALPTAAAIGILWWMCPFFPKSDKAPKLTGSALVIYLFYNLIRGAYHG